jgi:hypothetical protein
VALFGHWADRKVTANKYFSWDNFFMKIFYRKNFIDWNFSSLSFFQCQLFHFWNFTVTFRTPKQQLCSCPGRPCFLFYVAVWWYCSSKGKFLLLNRHWMGFEGANYDFNQGILRFYCWSYLLKKLCLISVILQQTWFPLPQFEQLYFQEEVSWHSRWELRLRILVSRCQNFLFHSSVFWRSAI